MGWNRGLTDVFSESKGRNDRDTRGEGEGPRGLVERPKAWCGEGEFYGSLPGLPSARTRPPDTGLGRDSGSGARVK